jgi:hypothetical protein
MYEFAGSKSAKLVVREYGKLVARILQPIALPARVSTLINPHTYFAGFAVFYNTNLKFTFRFLLLFLPGLADNSCQG